MRSRNLCQLYHQVISSHVFNLIKPLQCDLRTVLSFLLSRVQSLFVNEKAGDLASELTDFSTGTKTVKIYLVLAGMGGSWSTLTSLRS